MNCTHIWQEAGILKVKSTTSVKTYSGYFFWSSDIQFVQCLCNVFSIVSLCAKLLTSISVEDKSKWQAGEKHRPPENKLSSAELKTRFRPTPNIGSLIVSTIYQSFIFISIFSHLILLFSFFHFCPLTHELFGGSLLSFLIYKSFILVSFFFH